MNPEQIFIGIFITILGLLFGSFATMLSYRLPLGQDIVFKRSYCPKCNHNLSFLDLFPVFSWIFFAGKCHYCKVKIPLRYPLIELSTAGIFLSAYMIFGFNYMALLIATIGFFLLVISIIDFEHYIIPDSLQIILLILAIIYAYLQDFAVVPVLIRVFAVVTFIILLSLSFKFIRKKEGLGFGDVKFFAIAAIFLSFKPFILFMFLSGVFGTLIGLIWKYIGKGEIFPFAPALCGALYICLVVA